MKKCVNFKDRLIGLMGKVNVIEDYYFPNCNSVHTFFMKTNIDVIFLDKNGIVLDITKNVKPFRIVFGPNGTKSIIETKTNSNYKIKESVKFN